MICDHCGEDLTSGYLTVRKYPKFDPLSGPDACLVIDLKFCDGYCLHSYIESRAGTSLLDHTPKKET